MDSFKFLFDSSYDRYVGNPHQSVIHTSQELHNFISRNNGINPCFVTLNSFQNGGMIARTVFNDFDAEFKLTCRKCGEKIKESSTPYCQCGNRTDFDKESEEEKRKKVYAKIKQAQRLFLTYQEYGIDCVPDFTAVKGCHIFPLFKPEKFANSELITKLFYFFMEQSKCYDTVEEEVTIEGQKQVKSFKYPHADTVVVSDNRRLCRIPGTKRTENNLHCISISPELFPYIEPEEMFDLAKYPTASVQVSEPTMKMSEFEFQPVDETQFKSSRTSSLECMDSTLNSIPEDTRQFIQDMIPQHCVRTYISTIEPFDEVRYNAVVHFRKIGLSPAGIVDLFSRLGWRDYSEDTTSYRVNNIYYNQRCRFSHSNMRKKGLCNKAECRFHRR